MGWHTGTVLDVSPTKAASRPTARRRPDRPIGVGNDFLIVLVCSANLCRSPMAEYLLRKYIEENKLPVRVSSAGTHAKPDMPMHPLARQALASLQIEVPSFTSRQLTSTIVDRSNIILTMTDAQRSWVVKKFPAAVQRTYLLSQFSRLVGAADPVAPVAAGEWGPSLIGRAVHGRTLVQPLVEGRDIEDPIGRPLRQFQNCARLIEQRLNPLFVGITEEPAT